MSLDLAAIGLDFGSSGSEILECLVLICKVRAECLQLRLQVTDFALELIFLCHISVDLLLKLLLLLLNGCDHVAKLVVQGHLIHLSLQ